MKMRIGMMLLALILAVSCKNSVDAGNMAEEICNAMEKYRHDEPMSKYDAASDLDEIRKNGKYQDVSDAQIKKIMLKKCPDGWHKYQTLKNK